MSEWLPIETAPKDGMPQLVGYHDEDIDNWIYRIAYCQIVSDNDEASLRHADIYWVTLPGHRLIYPTHWQPLPDPPESPPQLHPDATGG